MVSISVAVGLKILTLLSFVVFGMAGTNTQIIGGTLKTVYEDFVAEQTIKKFPLKGLDSKPLFKWRDVDFAGAEVVYDAHVLRNISPMFCGEDGAFADAGAQGSIKVHIGQRKLMARVRLTSESIADSMKSEGAFTAARRDEMTRIIDDIARMEEYALSSDGRGVLALIDGDPGTSTTVTLDSPGGISGDDFGNRYLLPGMYIGCVDPSTGDLRSGVKKVTACASTGLSVTIDAAADASWADNDYVVQVANSSVTDILDTSYEHGFMGLTGLFDDGTYRNNYFNVDRSQWQQYQTYVKAATGALSLDLFQQVADVVDQKLGGSIDQMTAHHSVRRLYLNMLVADRRYSGNNLLKPDGGTVAMKQGDLTMGEVPITAIRTHPLAMMFLLDTKNSGFVCYGSEKGKWVDEDGSVLVRVGSGTSARDSFEAWYRKRLQYHVRYPGKNARLDGITGQSLIVVRDF
jgi:hypothetical protein